MREFNVIVKIMIGNAVQTLRKSVRAVSATEAIRSVQRKLPSYAALLNAKSYLVRPPRPLQGEYNFRVSEWH